jgi:hypothetical protein
VNTDLPSGNSASIFECKPATPTYHCSLFTTLPTDGYGYCGGCYGTPRISLENISACLFVVDVGSSDIAAFAKIGSKFVAATGFPFSKSTLEGDYAGIGLAGSPDGPYFITASLNESSGLSSPATDRTTLASSGLQNIESRLFSEGAD